MRRLLIAVILVALATSSGSALAGQKQVSQSIQVPPLTTEQIVMDCAISGVLFSAIGGLGVLKPVTVALSTMTTFALLHEAIYGCGLGVISGYASQSLINMIPMPPQPSPFDLPGGALVSSDASSRR